MKSAHWLLSLLILVSDALGSTETAREAAPEKSYLFSYFLGNGESGLHLAASRDGYRWEALNEGRSYLTPKVGESKLMRDPCLLRGPDGTFHLVWTTSWQGKTIGYAASRDLIRWSEQQAIPVMAHEPTALNCWAPEIVWDAKREELFIFWATTIPGRFPDTDGQGDDQYNHRIYSTTTRDFQTFTPTKLFYDPGFNVIDATILPAFGRYYLIIKDETRHPPKKHLRIASSDDLVGPYENLGPPFTRDWVEGPSAIQLGEDFLVYFDAYRDRRYEARRSRDLKTWEDVTDKLNLPRGARHGTVMQVPGSVIDRLRSPAGPAGKPTLFLIGDSTVNTGTRGQRGWGQELGGLVDADKLVVANRARGGRSSRTFLTEGLWNEVKAELKAGDFVLIQFGHNDGGPLDVERARGSLRGVGDESRVITNANSGKLETVHSYGWYLRQFVRDTKARGATPIIASLVPRNIWKAGTVVRAEDSYAGWAAAVARSENVPFLDLNELIATRYEQMGTEAVQRLFSEADHTHTSPEGAKLNAAVVAEGLRKLTNLPLPEALLEAVPK